MPQVINFTVTLPSYSALLLVEIAYCLRPSFSLHPVRWEGNLDYFVISWKRSRKKTHMQGTNSLIMLIHLTLDSAAKRLKYSFPLTPCIYA